MTDILPDQSAPVVVADGATWRRFGARVVGMQDGTILVQQTVKSGPAQNDRYVIDRPQDRLERFVDESDDFAIAATIRDALRGQLQA
jgi:hypothetical protein